MEVKRLKVKGVYSFSWETLLRATGCHLRYEITQCYLPLDTSEHAPPNPYGAVGRDSPSPSLPLLLPSLYLFPPSLSFLPFFPYMSPSLPCPLQLLSSLPLPLKSSCPEERCKLHNGSRSNAFCAFSGCNRRTFCHLHRPNRLMTQLLNVTSGTHMQN